MTISLRKSMNVIAVLGTVLLIVLLVWMFSNGYFTDSAALQSLLNQAGWLAPFLFVFIQMIQVVIPIIPGGISCALGVVAFGSAKGFLYNYIGVVLGSIVLFLLVKKFGKPFVQNLMSRKNYEKYIGWLDKGNKFDKFFAIAIFAPFAPDDALCMIAGLTKMSTKKFSVIIALGKPLSLFLYSYGVTSLLTWAATLF